MRSIDKNNYLESFLIKIENVSYEIGVKVLKEIYQIT